MGFFGVLSGFPGSIFCPGHFLIFSNSRIRKMNFLFSKFSRTRGNSFYDNLRLSNQNILPYKFYRWLPLTEKTGWPSQKSWHVKTVNVVIFKQTTSTTEHNNNYNNDTDNNNNKFFRAFQFVLIKFSIILLIFSFPCRHRRAAMTTTITFLRHQAWNGLFDKVRIVKVASFINRHPSDHCVTCAQSWWRSL